MRPRHTLSDHFGAFAQRGKKIHCAVLSQKWANPLPHLATWEACPSKVHLAELSSQLKFAELLYLNSLNTTRVNSFRYSVIYSIGLCSPCYGHCPCLPSCYSSHHDLKWRSNTHLLALLCLRKCAVPVTLIDLSNVHISISTVTDCRHSWVLAQ